MYGDVNTEYANLLKQAAGLAKTRVAASTEAEKQATLRTWLFAGGAGVAAVVLFALILRR